MQTAEVVLSVLRERGRRGLSCTQLYRQLFNKDLYLLAYGNIYSNQGAMTPGASEGTADGMSEEKIEQIMEAMRRERYRFSPARRTYIPKKNGKLRPLGMPTWSDKLVGEAVRLLLEAIYEPQFSDSSHGFRKFRGCHTALREINNTWTGTTWFVEGDISDCFGSLDHEILLGILAWITRSFSGYWRRRSTITVSSGWCATCSRPGTSKTGNTGKRSAEFRRAARFPRSLVTFTCTNSTSSSSRN